MFGASSSRAIFGASSSRDVPLSLPLHTPDKPLPHSLRRLLATPSYSKHSPGEQSWTTEYIPTKFETLAIASIAIKVNSGFIQSLEIKYNDGTIKRSSITVDGTVIETYEMVLDSDEWIVKIQWNYQSCAVKHLTFVSNKGRTYGSYGGTKPVNYEFTIEAPTKEYGVLWLNGCAGTTHITSLQATFATFDTEPQSLSFLRLENGPYSTFLKQLLSPIVTLLVGTPAKSISVHEDVISNIPFFAAALHGEFLEARTKTIKMPEDDPVIIAALIEYLFMGRYTYASANAGDKEISAVDQALFHLKLHTAAAKYDCPALGKDAMRALRVILEGLNSIDSLRVWKEGYQLSMSVEDLETDPLKTVKRKVRYLLANHVLAMSGMLEDAPELAMNLLKLMATEEAS